MNSESISKLVFFIAAFGAVYFFGAISYHYSVFPSTLPFQAKNALQSYFLPIPHHIFPARFDTAGVTINKTERMAPGVTLLTSYWKDQGWRAGVRIVDAQGETLHHWDIDTSKIFVGGKGNATPDTLDYVHGSYLYPNGDLLINIEYKGLAKLNACGETIWVLEDPATHHSVYVDENGMIWAAANKPYISGEPSGEALKKFPGLQSPVYDDYVLKISPDGTPLLQFSMLDLLYKNDLQRLAFRNASRRSDDILHLNDVETLPKDFAEAFPMFEAGDVLLSLRNASMVLVVDPETQIVKWTSTVQSTYQHDPDFLPNGRIGIFDNNFDRTIIGDVLGGSRIVSVDPSTGKSTILFSGREGDRFYTSFGGKWQTLENSNLILAEARTGRVMEVDISGEIVWEWIQDRYNDDMVAEVLEATRYSLTPQTVSGWSCDATP